jgi:hypothetical protein
MKELQSQKLIFAQYSSWNKTSLDITEWKLIYILLINSKMICVQGMARL